MKFHIGPWVYRVVIKCGELVDADGADVVGLCVWADKTIYISHAVARERRFEILLHELRHAWRYQFGRAIGEEDDADNTAAFAGMCVKELMAQGGEKALMEMEPEEAANGDDVKADRESIETFANSSAPGGGSECGICGRRFNPGEIVTGNPEFHVATGRLIVSRTLYCEGCGEAQQWHEGAMHDGSPSGQPVGKLTRLRGPKLAEWLQLHGDQVGVFVSSH